jgi:serine/threonine protein kinase
MRIKDKGIKFIDILSHYSCAIIGSLSVDGIYYIWKHSEEDFDLEPEETHFKSFDQMLAQTYGISLRLTEGLIDFNDPFVRKQFYCENYSEIEILGKGSFSTVFKAMTKQLLDRELIAMKKIELENKNFILKEFINYSLVHELDPQFIVKQYNSWFEYNYDFNDEKLVLFIEMELCDQTLDYIIEELHNTLTANDALTPLGYYMASQLFIEILEAVNYLHKQNPPLIHRNLKPVNIMLKKDNNNERIIKIADFGLMAINQFTDHSHTSNETTNQYMAPEVIRNKKYDTKADIYSLGQIMQSLFDIDVNRFEFIYQFIY